MSFGPFLTFLYKSQILIMWKFYKNLSYKSYGVSNHCFQFFYKLTHFNEFYRDCNSSSYDYIMTYPNCQMFVLHVRVWVKVCVYVCVCLCVCQKMWVLSLRGGEVGRPTAFGVGFSPKEDFSPTTIQPPRKLVKNLGHYFCSVMFDEHWVPEFSKKKIVKRNCEWKHCQPIMKRL